MLCSVSNVLLRGQLLVLFCLTTLFQLLWHNDKYLRDEAWEKNVVVFITIIMMLFWVLAPCRLVSRCRHFGEITVSMFRAEDCRRFYTATKPRTSSSSSSSPPWELQISHVVRYSPGICLKELRKITRNLSRSTSWNLNRCLLDNTQWYWSVQAHWPL
jgi:hypothetical protein